MMAFVPLVLCLLAATNSASIEPEVTRCELTTGRTLTVIKSAGFPDRYGPNVDCRYTVRRRSKSVCSVTFLFNVMDLEPSPNCTKDYLLLSGEKMCGSKPIGFSRTVTFPEDDQQITMSFHSDNETRGLGYMVTVVQQECPLPNCDASFDGKEDFVLTSPNYPLPYDNGRFCTYTVKKAHENICRLMLKVEHFDVEEDHQCGSDFLLVNGERLCGVMDEGQIIDASFLNDTMILEFQSDHVTTRDGFRFNVHQEKCGFTTNPQPSTSVLASELNTITTVTSETSPSNVTSSTDYNTSTSTQVAQ